MAVSIPRNDVRDVLANMKAIGQSEVVVDGKGTKADVDLDKEVEFQTDKQQVKLVPCRECRRALVVTTFFAPAKAICASCSGKEAMEGDGRATVAQPKPGDTDPRKAIDLTATLINQQFAEVNCPLDGETMVLVNVTHSDNYGPSTLVGYKNGQPVYRQTAKGEVAMHQCRHCKLTITFNTTVQQQISPMNAKRAPDLGRRPGITLELLNGTVRDEPNAQDAAAAA